MTVLRHKLTTKAATVEKSLREAVQAAKPSKYRNVPIEIDGRRFASKAEGKRYLELKLMERAKVFTLLRLQPRYELYAGAKSEKICTYVGDFEYFIPETGTFVTEDVKGMLTPEFKLKAKLFKANLGYDITIIKA